ncbi:MAG: right-handed parallel beta-helix repeat-containing protein [Candidatus Altarchaeum sp.]|nr:right-handed parallel beta-helix repeat-containing protein [Candidatus Altarchaeum sp.]
MYSSSNIKITNNKFSSEYESIYIKKGTKCALENNILKNMELTKIHLLNSNENSISDNDFIGTIGNSVTAIFLEKSNQNLIKNNNTNDRKKST